MENFIASWGYVGVFVLSLLSSACIPIPSEVALGYAGVLASGAAVSGGHHHLDLALVIIVGTLGAVAGSLIAYVVGRTGARKLVDKYGRYVLVGHEDLDRGEAWFDRHGEPAVFFGRLIPLVRSFISLPAGMAEMNIVKFTIFTTLGAAIWTAALCSIGYGLAGTWHSVTKGIGFAGYVVAGITVIALVVLVVWRYRSMKARQTGAGPRHAAGAPKTGAVLDAPPVQAAADEVASS